MVRRYCHSINYFISKIFLMGEHLALIGLQHLKLERFLYCLIYTLTYCFYIIKMDSFSSSKVLNGSSQSSQSKRESSKGSSTRSKGSASASKGFTNDKERNKTSSSVKHVQSLTATIPSELEQPPSVDAYQWGGSVPEATPVPSASSVSQWGSSGLTFAEKLKKAEAEKAKLELLAAEVSYPLNPTPHYSVTRLCP